MTGTGDHSLHFGVDATCWLLPRGFGRHTRCLIRALLAVDAENRYTLFVDSPEVAAAAPAGARVVRVPTRQTTIEGASAQGHRRLGDLWRMSRALSDDDLDAILFPNVMSFVPVRSRARKLVVFHDVTAETHPLLTLHSRTARLLWRVKSVLARRQADVLLTISEHSRRGLAAQFDVPAESIHVIGVASDPAFRRISDPQPTPRLRALDLDGSERLVVYVGGFSPHKNLGTLVSVFDRLAKRPEFADLRLVFVGEHREETFFSCFAEIEAQVAELELEGRVSFTGFVPDEDLAVLLNRAAVLVLPSLNEGLGLPAIEAAACGCPVVATRQSPLPELLGEGGLFVDPHVSTQLEEALAEVLGCESRRQRMRQAGIAAAARLSWNGVGRQLVGLMEATAGS